MNASSVNWRNEIHDNITLKISYIFFLEILDWEIFQAILENLEEIWIGTRGRISAPTRVQKKPDVFMFITM